MSDNSRRQSRGLPEYATYSDTGCDLASSCLECPLALCKYDDPMWGKRHDLTIRDDEVMRQHESGASVEQIAQAVGVSARTVYRVIQRRSRKSDSPREQYLGGPVITLEELADWTPVQIYPVPE